VNGHRIDAFDQLISAQDLDDEKTIVLRSGKKRFHKILVQRTEDQRTEDGGQRTEDGGQRTEDGGQRTEV
jgi:hypothetical protein